MTSNLKRTNGWAHNGVFYATEREALLSALTTDEDYPVNKATLYSDGSVLVMDNANIVIDRFVDRYTKLTPTEYENAPEPQGQYKEKEYNTLVKAEVYLTLRSERPMTRDEVFGMLSEIGYEFGDEEGYELEGDEVAHVTMTEWTHNEIVNLNEESEYDQV